MSFSTPDREVYWSNEWGGKVLFSHGSNDSRGIMILFKPSLSFQVDKIESDNAGRYVISDVRFNGKKFTLVNVYGPNIDDPVFYNRILQKLGDFEGDKIINM